MSQRLHQWRLDGLAHIGHVFPFAAGLILLRGASSELADHKPGMMTLISLAILVALGKD